MSLEFQGLAEGRPAWSLSRVVARFGPISLLLVGLVLFFALGLDRFVSLEALRDHRQAAQDFVAGNPIWAAGLFLAVYAVSVALSIPGAIVLSLAAGFLFGWLLASLLIVIAATLGACALFLAARTALADMLRRRAAPWMARVEAGFRRDAASYLLTLRLIPLVPFWLVNLVPAFFGVSLRVFAATTFVGIIPGTVVIASLGSGLGAALDREEPPDLGILLSTEILAPLFGLAALALLPILYRWWQARRSRPS